MGDSKSYINVRNIISIIIIGFALLLIFTPDIESLEKLRYLNSYFMLGFLALAMLMLFLSEKRLMFASITACALLCIFLKSVSNQHIVLPEINDLADIKLVHFNLGNFEGHPDSVLKLINTTDADLISFQEFTPSWDNYFKNKIGQRFDYFSKDVRIDPYGMCIFSNFPIKNASIYYANDIPNFKSEIIIDGKTRFNLFSSYVLPPFQQKETDQTKEHLNQIANRIEKANYPALIFGDFNMVYWSDELIHFRSKLGLLNSRRDANISLVSQSFDHIFYSDELECTSFDEILDSNGKHIGIKGVYQIKKTDEEMKKTILSIR